MPSPRRTVLDSYAVLSFLFGERGSQQVLQLFDWAIDNCQQHLITSVNWAEVRYVVERKSGSASWPRVKERLLNLPLSVIPVDRELAELAGSFKRGGGMALADCFAAALAKQQGLPLCTGDREYRRVERAVKILWL